VTQQLEENKVCVNCEQPCDGNFTDKGPSWWVYHEGLTEPCCGAWVHKECANHSDARECPCGSGLAESGVEVIDRDESQAPWNEYTLNNNQVSDDQWAEAAHVEKGDGDQEEEEKSSVATTEHHYKAPSSWYTDEPSPFYSDAEAVLQQVQSQASGYAEFFLAELRSTGILRPSDRDECPICHSRFDDESTSAHKGSPVVVAHDGELCGGWIHQACSPSPDVRLWCSCGKLGHIEAVDPGELEAWVAEHGQGTTTTNNSQAPEKEEKHKD
jgi:hypothetical protein